MNGSFVRHRPPSFMPGGRGGEHIVRYDEQRGIPLRKSTRRGNVNDGGASCRRNASCCCDTHRPGRLELFHPKVCAFGTFRVLALSSSFVTSGGSARGLLWACDADVADENCHHRDVGKESYSAGNRGDLTAEYR